MRVICVTEMNFHAGGISESGIKVGDIHEVVREAFGIDNSGNRIPCYKLAAFINTIHVHDQRNFATLPDASADEMQEEETATIHEPVNR